MTAKMEFEKIYSEVAASITSSRDELASISVANKDGQEHIANVVKQLGVIQDQFSEQLDLLEKNSEWDVFTVAFFGETNAGKSTILESLRILFDEESRRKLIVESEVEIEAISDQIKVHADRVKAGFSDAYLRQKNRALYANNEIKKLSEILEDESRERVRLEEIKTSFQVKRNMVLMLLLGIAAGAGAAFLLATQAGG